jgi:uDENN domain/DENN (AEX-3) domain
MSNYNSVIPNPQPLNTEPNMHPLKQRFEPVLLDRYPQKTMKEEIQRRAPFPDYVPMFAFPNDVYIVSSDERPRSTWHGFAMTTADNSRLYGICILMWMPLNQQASADLERKCDQWRKKNMTPEERELASSLGERLVIERANLSRLLAKLPTIIPESRERQALEDEIGAVEEKIGLMTDLLRPMRHGAASKIDGLTEGETGFWVPRAYGILGREASHTSFWKEWLRAVTVPMMNNSILRVPPSSPKIGVWQPLERYVVNLCTEALSPITSKTQVEVSVRELQLFARKEALNELPGSRNVSFESTAGMRC